jgi:hypothetical protein
MRRLLNGSHGLPILCGVKKWIAYMCVFTQCSLQWCRVPFLINAKKLNIQHKLLNHFPLKDCNNCSPFSVCAAAQGFAVTHESFSLETFAYNSDLLYGEHNFSSKLVITLVIFSLRVLPDQYC